MEFNLQTAIYKNADKFKNFFQKIHDDSITVSTDTRNIKSGEFFIAIKGENFDGHAFVEAALEKSAAGIIANKSQVKKEIIEKNKAIHWILVEDSLLFMQELAIEKLRVWKQRGGVVISMTGSNGKTTNKEILYSILSNLFPGEIASTQGNFNNQIGVPLTIFAIQDQHKYALLEIGTNHPGEIERLSEIAQPDVGYITNIGDAHLEYLINREGVFNEKRALYDYVVKNSKRNFIFLKNSYDPFLKTLEQINGVVAVGEDTSNEVIIEENEVSLKINGERFHLENSFIREYHNLLNLGLCTQLLVHMFPEKQNEIIEKAKQVKLPENNRSEWINYKNKKIFLDAYNANPSSMKASLQSFIQNLNNDGIDKNTALFILGDMNELGEKAESMHHDIASFLETNGVKNVAFIGRYRAYYQKGISVEDLGSENVDSFLKNWPQLLEKFSYFYIKGSRSVKLEELTKAL